MSEYLFVYGTLRENPHQIGNPVGRDRIKGKLYDLGGAPGYYPLGPEDQERWVVGEVIDIDPSVLPFLDRYEGIERGLYSRERVTTESGREAWVYQVNPLFTQAPLIDSGDWFRGSNSGFTS